MTQQELCEIFWMCEKRRRLPAGTLFETPIQDWITMLNILCEQTGCGWALFCVPPEMGARVYFTQKSSVIDNWKYVNGKCTAGESRSGSIQDAIALACEHLHKELGWHETKPALPPLTGKLKISLDGGMYCVLMGENLQVGIAGFGETFAEAMENFHESAKISTPGAFIGSAMSKLFSARCKIGPVT